MKSVILCVVLCLGWMVVSLQAAAVEPVVEELQADVSAKPTEAANVDEELLTNADCHQPKETGRCFALFYRFAFDVEKRECVEFIYGGCSGNSNNFESKEACELKCLKKSEEAAVDSTTLVAAEEEDKESHTTPSSPPSIADAVPEQNMSS